MPAINPIQRARPAQVCDRQLAALRRVAHDVPNSLASEAECEWLLGAVPALLDELAARRAWMDGHAQGIDLSNIIPLPGVR
jgi:hypothetical protein